MRDLFDLPADLPIPVDDGACAHLVGTHLPSSTLIATRGEPIDLAARIGRVVVFAFPRTGRPGHEPLVPTWDAIPGARGCTPQTCGFRDAYGEFFARGVEVYGLSTQDPLYQAEMAARLDLPFAVLSDEHCVLAGAMNLPTFVVDGQTLIRRLAWLARDGVIEKVWYPVFPPNENAATILADDLLNAQRP